MRPGTYAAATLPGFTLVELIVAVAVTSILMLAIGSTIVVATYALPDDDRPAGAVIAAGAAAEWIATELQYAVMVNHSSANMVEFTVADRDNDDAPETIRYEWSGTAGAPLTRQYNAGTLANVLDRVQQFELAYDVETISEEVPQSNESAETTLAGYYSGNYLAGRNVQTDRWRGQYFMPLLPPDAINWKVTGVKFYAKAEYPAGGECRLQLQLATAGGLPTGVVLEEKVLLESTLNPYFYSLQDFTFSSVSGLAPNQGLCLVFKWISGVVACRICIREQGVPAANGNFMRSADRGATWTEYPDQSLLFWVYGTVTTPGIPQIEETVCLHGIEMKVRSGRDDPSDVRTRVKTLNKPEITQ